MCIGERREEDVEEEGQEDATSQQVRNNIRGQWRKTPTSSRSDGEGEHFQQ